MAYDEAEIRKEYKALFENSLDLIYAHDLKGNFFDANDIALETLGYKIEDIPNLSFKDLIDKDQIANAFNTIKELKEKGKQSKRTKFKLKVKNGDFIYVETYGIPLKKNGEIFGILGFATDITERMNTEKKIKESESKFRIITEQILMGIVILQDDVLKYVNSTLAKMGEYSPQEIIGWSINDFIKLLHPEDLPFIMKQAKKKQMGDLDLESRYSCRIFTKSGKLKWVDVYSKSILYQGKPADFITLIDITEKEKAKQSIKRKLEFERIISRISSRFVGTSNINDAINISLCDMGMLSKASRSYLFLFSEDNKTMNNSHEWCTEGVSSQIDTLQDLPLEMFPWWMDKLKKGEYIHITDVLKIPLEAATEKEILKIQDVKSLLVFPLTIGEKLSGFIGFDNVRDTGAWNDDDFALLQIFSEIIGNSLKRKKIEQALKESEESLKKLNEELELKVSKRTQELKKSEKKYREILENIKEAYFELDLKGNITFFNNMTCEFTGCSADELIGMNYLEFTDKEKVEEVFEKFNSVYEYELPQSIFESEIISKNGKKRFIESSFYLKMDSKGSKIGFSGLARDINERKKSEQKLKESEEKYRHLFNNSPFSILLADTKGNIMECNSTIEKLYGIKKEEIIGKNYKEILSLFKITELKTFFEDRIKRILEDINPPPIEIPCYIKDDSLVWVILHNFLVTLSEKRFIQIILQDITDRKIAEKELKKLNRELEYKVVERTKELEKSEKKFRRIFESIPDLFFLVDEKTTIIDYRGKREDFFIPPEQFLSKKLSDILPFKLGKMVKEYVSKTISSKQPRILEYSLPIKDEVQYYEARFLFFTKNRVAIFIRDITERKLAEDKLKESEEKYRTLFDEAPIGILTCDVNGTILNVNKNAVELLGSPSKEATKQINLLTFPLLMRAGISGDFEKCINEGRQISSERPYITKWEKFVFLRYKLVPTLDQEGKTIRILSAFDDISKLKQAEEKLRKQNIELKRLDELKNDFITIAAHELKTPMISITGYTDYILTHHKDLDFEIRKDVLLIQKNSQRLNLLIEQLLDVMIIDAKKMEVTLEKKNLYDIIENCLEELSFELKEKNINIIIDVQKDLYLRVDANRIYEVFSNLFSNAVKYTLNDGNIKISAKKVKDQFLFKIRNEGKGLSIRDIRRLFKKFEVIEKESADHIDRKKGLGLGLYISKGIVEAHGGKIWGTSKGKDKGAEFYFTLPIIET